MARPLELPVEPSSTFELFPLRVASDHDEYLVGGDGARSYLSLTSEALEATTLLGNRVPVGRVKELLAAKYSVDSVTLAPLLEQLVSAGLVRTIDGYPVERHDAAPRRRPWLTPELVAPLFGVRAAVVYAVILAAAVLAILSDPRCLPRVRVLVADRSIGMLLLSLMVLAVVVVKHEFAHVAAARSLGVGARCRLGHRLMFPVVETDLSGLWLVGRGKRYLAYLAGVTSDVLAAAVAIIGIWVHLHGWIALSPTVYLALELTVLIVAAVVLWQFNVFLRTDGYYVLANALGCRNLAGDAKAFLRSTLWPRRAERSDASAAATYPRCVRFYAAGYALTAVVVIALWVAGVGLALRGAGVGSRATPAAVAVSVVLLAVGILAERKRTRCRYQLVFPPGL